MDSQPEPYGATADQGVLVDGVPDLHLQIGALHDRARIRQGKTQLTLYRHEDIVAVTKRRDVHSMDPELIELTSAALGAGRPLIPLMLDDDEHRAYRKLLDPLFAPAKVAALQPTVRALANSLIDAFADEGTAEVYKGFCEPLPSQIFLSLLGLPLDDLPFLLWFKDGIIRPSDSTHHDDANQKMIDYLYAELDRRQALDHPGDDLIGGFLTVEVDGRRLTREDVIDIVFLLVLAGLDTVASSLSLIIDWLARHPDERARLVSDPSVWPAAIEELLRIFTPVVAGGRYAVEDFEVNGIEIKKGQQLETMWAAANLDPRAFADPLKVDFDREDNRHIAFASGFHRCLGSHLARMELRVALETFHQRIPDYRLDPDRRPGYRNVLVRCVDPLPLVFPT